MNRFLLLCLGVVLRLGMWLRYKVTYKGLEKLTPEAVGESGGVLFLPNHPSVFVDPALVMLGVYRRFAPHPMVIEYAFYGTGIHGIMKRVGALPIPDITRSRNSVKLRRTEMSFQTVMKGLRQGENYLIYPSGMTKRTGREILGGASGVHRIIQEVPDVKVVLVRITGLWGSSFSRAITGAAPPFFPTLMHGAKWVLKNLIFFMPRRRVTIEFEPAPANFPWGEDRITFNQYLENWYNRYPSPTGEVHTVEPFYQVSYAFWAKRFLDPKPTEDIGDKDINLDAIPESTKWTVYEELARMSKRNAKEIKPGMSLARDLALDSLDAADLLIFLEDEFEVKGVNPGDLTTVHRLLGIADKQVVGEQDELIDTSSTNGWDNTAGRPKAEIPEGETVGEVFLRACDRLGKHPACADARSGMMTYRRLKMAALLMADVIKDLPGDKIGILLPSSVGSSVLILATQLAGKVPVMVNWTVGPRHLDTVVKVSGVQTVLTAWAFIDRLENADLSGIDDKLVMMEELRPDISLRQKLRAFWRSRKSASALVSELELDKVNRDDPAVLLFTSGTESHPKGVPLSHRNILANLRGALPCVALKRDDVVHSMLPPFHSFGFTVLGLLPILAGVRAVYSANPTDAIRCIHDVGKWGVSLIAGAPSFLKGLLKAANKDQLRRVRMVVSGAEAAPPDLLAAISEIGPEVLYLEGYGITECAPILTVRQPGIADHGVGTPVPGVELLIVHPETHEPLPVGSRGLILARGDNVFSGYVSVEKLPEPFFEIEGERWYNTGDLGFLDETGCLNLSGRLKRFVKVGGEMVSLTAMETALVEQAKARGWKLALEGPSIAVSAKESDGRTEFYAYTCFPATTMEVNQALRDAGFSNLVKVSKVHHLESLPVMGTGKTNYRQLEKEFHD